MSGVAHFWAAARRNPVRSVLGLIIEYAMFASAIFLAVSLLVTRVPLRILDVTFGLRLRQRFVDFLGKVSPG